MQLEDEVRKYREKCTTLEEYLDSRCFSSQKEQEQSKGN